MSKGEISELSGDDMVEFERHDAARYQSRAEAPQVRAPVDALSPPTAPVTPAPDLHATAKARWRPSLQLALMAAGILVVAIGSFTYWLRGGRYASSDDAYIEYAKAQVTTDVSGIVTKVDVHEGEVVKAGQILFQLDPLQYQIALQNAHANLYEVALRRPIDEIQLSGDAEQCRRTAGASRLRPGYIRPRRRAGPRRHHRSPDLRSSALYVATRQEQARLAAAAGAS